MYQTFHSCRQPQPYSDTCLHALELALSIFSQTNTTTLTLPVDTFQQLPPRVQERICLPEDDYHHTSVPITIPKSARPLLHLIRLATPELQHLWQQQKLDIVRALGYTLHVIPYCLE